MRKKMYYILIIGFILNFSVIVSASTKNEPKIDVSLVNIKTGVSKNIEYEVIDTFNVNQRKNITVKGLDVVAEIDLDDLDIPISRASGGTEDYGSSYKKISARATLNFEVETMSDNSAYKRITRVYGSWKALDNYTSFYNRRVMVAQGALITKATEYSPNINSFSYKPGFGYAKYYPSEGSYIIWGGSSRAKVDVNGMATDYEIEIVYYF